MTEISKAAEDVIAERCRQVEAEGWTTEHDDTHPNGAMADAAAVSVAVARRGKDRPLRR